MSHTLEHLPASFSAPHPSDWTKRTHLAELITHKKFRHPKSAPHDGDVHRVLLHYKPALCQWRRGWILAYETRDVITSVCATSYLSVLIHL